MPSTYTFGFSTTWTVTAGGIPGSGIGGEVGVQTGFVRDGATGQWYSFTNYIYGGAGSPLQADLSLDFFVLKNGVPASSLAGSGSYVGVGLPFQAGVIRDGNGNVIGVQTGIISNLTAGGYITYTTLTPIDKPPIEHFQFIRDFWRSVNHYMSVVDGLLGNKPSSLIPDPLKRYLKDPLVLDLDGDGVELISLANSNAHLDYGGDGFAERTGWVKGDDGILVFDRNANGTVDGIGEMFGSATQDGFEVLEALDTNHDGKIDTADADFASLRVWQDANEDGISDAGELKTLAELGIQSISLSRTDVTGTNGGHDRGFAATFTRTDGSTGAAETIYFQTDRADTVDPTPTFTPAEGVDKLPQLPGSGNLFSLAYKLTNDAAFRADWTALADNAS